MFNSDNSVPVRSMSVNFKLPKVAGAMALGLAVGANATQTLTSNHMDHPEAKIAVSTAFNLPDVGGMELAGMAPGNPFAPKLNPDYVFALDRFRDMLTFWVMGYRALKIIGDPAAGKTSIVEQWHARMGMPLFIIGCHENMTETDFIGQFVPQANGTLKWVDSPVMSAYRHGGSVLLDEWNNLNPNAATMLNAMLEGYTVTIPQTGEVVVPHPKVRFYATQNPIDGKTAVQGRYVQDAASDDRFMEMEVDYLPADLETKVVVAAIRKFDKKSEQSVVETTASNLVKVANEIRKKFRANELVENAAYHKPMSTRVLTRWAQLQYAYRNAKGVDPTIYSMHKAFSGASAEMKTAVEQLIERTIGNTTYAS
ncbi:MoxR family ATPase [Comamonas sp. w2-DMI]|uniref:MoxR family ATPase n=1 Tax=Comamonas sp. w2-DMI TaxID=3126391 RepID=UPI0032E45E44